MHATINSVSGQSLASITETHYLGVYIVRSASMKSSSCV